MANIIVRWENNEHYREKLFVDNLVIAGEVHEYVLGPNDLNPLTQAHRKFLFQYLILQDSAGNYIIDISDPYIQYYSTTNTYLILNKCRVLNKINISALELIKELKYYEQLFALKQEEIAKTLAQTKAKKVIVTKAAVPYWKRLTNKFF